MSASPSSSASPGATLTPVVSSATEALYCAALGAGDVTYYLRVFAAFDERGLPWPRWNKAAGLLGLVWLIHRRLWRQAVSLALIGGVLALVLWWWGRDGAPEWAPVRLALGLLLIALLVAVPGLWGNAWLHNDVRERMTWAVRRARTVQEACGLLQHEQVQAPMLRGIGMALQSLLLLLLLWPLWQTLKPAAWADPSPAVSIASPTPSPSTGASSAAPLTVPLARPELAAAQASISPVWELPTETLLRPRWQGYGVNVGMFADQANAQRVEQRLSQAGLPVLVDPVESARGTLARVRVGPFDDMVSAELAAVQVRALGLEARVFGP